MKPCLSISQNQKTVSGHDRWKTFAKLNQGTRRNIILFMLIPEQDRRVLGSELIAGRLVLVLVAVKFHRRTLRRMVAGRRVRWALRLAVLHLGTVPMLVAGISLTVGQFGGLFWLVPTILIYMLWSLNNAWLLVVQASEEES